jgi:hypothetical protein
MTDQQITAALSTIILEVLSTQDVDVFTENGVEPNFALQTRAFVMFAIEIDRRDKVSLGSAGTGVQRATGGITFGIFDKVGNGTLLCNGVRSALNDALSNRYVNGVIVGDVQKFKPVSFQQWYGNGIQFVFTDDTIH